MTDNNKHENKTEELLEKQEAQQLTEEELAQVSGGRSMPLDIPFKVSTSSFVFITIPPVDIEMNYSRFGTLIKYISV